MPLDKKNPANVEIKRIRELQPTPPSFWHRLEVTDFIKKMVDGKEEKIPTKYGPRASNQARRSPEDHKKKFQQLRQERKKRWAILNNPKHQDLHETA